MVLALRDESCWEVIADPRTPEQRSADLVIAKEPDEPDRRRRLFEDAMALCAEYFESAPDNTAAPPCPGCSVRRLERHDAVAEVLEELSLARQRQLRRRNEANRKLWSIHLQLQIEMV
jgi:hypothetical protein